MQVFTKVTPLNALTDGASISLSSSLVQYVALNAGIPALGLWTLLCSVQQADQSSKERFCEKYNLTAAAFDKTMNKLAALNLVWQEADSGFEQDWFVANVPKKVADLTEYFMFELKTLFEQGDFSSTQAEQPASTFAEQQLNIVPDYEQLNNGNWQQLRLEQDFFDLGVIKLPAELVPQYWDTFIASNDNKGELVPPRNVLLKKWKSYVANVSVNLAVSERRSAQNFERKVEQNTAAQQRNIEAWQALLETKIPQAQSFSAAMHNLSNVEDDVWLGFIQQHIRLKSEPLNLTNLQYAFEEYCKTTGQKFLKQVAVPKEIDNTLNDTSWADNLDDIL